MSTHSDSVNASLGSRTADTEFSVGTLTLPAGDMVNVKAMVVSFTDDPGVSAVSKAVNMQIRLDSNASGFPGPPQKYNAGGFVSAPAGTNPTLGYQSHPIVIPLEGWSVSGGGTIDVYATALDEAPTGGTIQVALIYDI